MITILVNDTGNYEVWISVTNDEGYSSKSKVNEVVLSGMLASIRTLYSKYFLSLIRQRMKSLHLL